MLFSILFLLGGFLLLIKGSDWLVDGSCSIAESAGVSQLIIGLTLVSFGTSTPELFINFISRLSGDADMTIGNIIGSSIANILLILGVSAVFRPLDLKKSTVYWEIPYAAAMAVLLYLIIAFGRTPQNPGMLELSRGEGFLFLTFFLGFLVYIFALRKKEGRPAACGYEAQSPKRLLFLITGGILGLAFGAKGVVMGGVKLAASLGAPESVIALSVIAIGSTLPEMMTSVMAAIKKRSDIAVGNIVGSNIFNVCWILGLSAAVSPLSIGGNYLKDAGVLIGASLLLAAFSFFNKKRILTRLHGIVFVSLYGLYILMLAAQI